MSADTWAMIHTYGIVFSLGVFVGAGAVVLSLWLNARRGSTSAKSEP